MSLEVLYLDEPGASSMAAVAAMKASAYGVHRVDTITEFQTELLERGPLGRDTLAALVLDVSSQPERVRAIERAQKADPRLCEIPTVYLIKPGQQTPSGSRNMALKRPVSSPALVRLLDHALKGSNVLSSPGRTFVAQLDPMRRISGGTVTLGDYELIAEIASGGMGTVYLAQRRNEAGFARLFAVKIMHEHHTSDGDVRDMFLDEATIASRIHHSNVAAVVDLGMDGTRPYVVIQYVEGCSFAELLRGWEGPRPLELVLPIVLDALAGLQAAHELNDDEGEPLGFVHRDVSPENVLVGLDGIARITDFGVAKARGRITSTRKGVRKGKLQYLAPEQLMDKEMDARVDVFAAGVMLWNALTGKKLFLSESTAGVMHNILNAEIPPPSSIDSRIIPELDAVCLKALARDPDDRYSSARRMGAELRAVAAKNGLIGLPEQVGEWVESLYGTELRTRRRTIQLARQGRLPSESDIPVASAQTSIETVVPSTSPAVTTTVEAAEPKRRGLGLLLAGVLLGGATAGALAITCGESPQAEDTPREPAPKANQAPKPESEPLEAKTEAKPESEPAPEPAVEPETKPEAGPESPAPSEPAAAVPATEPPEEAPRPSSKKRRRKKPAPRPAPPKPAAEPPTPPPEPSPKPKPASKPKSALESGPESNPYR